MATRTTPKDSRVCRKRGKGRGESWRRRLPSSPSHTVQGAINPRMVTARTLMDLMQLATAAMPHLKCKILILHDREEKVRGNGVWASPRPKGMDKSGGESSHCPPQPHRSLTSPARNALWSKRRPLTSGSSTYPKVVMTSSQTCRLEFSRQREK